MLVPPLSERPVTEEDEERFRRESTTRKRSPLDRWTEYRAEARSSRPKGAKARVRSWMNADAFSWGMRATVVLLAIGGFYSLYINGVAEGWWHAWGDNPNTVATATPEAPPPPSEPAMSGGYQIGPDGVLVRPAEHAASTYTKPELPEEANENTERGAEAAAEHYLATLTYAWNTGDTHALTNMSAAEVPFTDGYVDAIDRLYTNGWAYGNELTVTEIVKVEPVGEEWGALPNTIGVLFHVTTINGVSCKGQQIVVSNDEYTVSLSLFMTWQGDRWLVTDGYIPHDDKY